MGFRVCKNLRGQHRLRAASLPKKVQLGGSTCASITFWLVDHSKHQILTRNVGGLYLITCFSDFCLIDLFWSYLRSKSEVVRNRAEFWRFFPPNFCWARHPKVVPTLSRLPRASSPGNITFRKVTPTNPEVIGTHVLNFKPNF